MRDLARLAGCSVMTVSFALRDSQQVSAETRERIQGLAAKHGYRKSPFISALMAKRRSPRSRQSGSGEVIALLTKFDVPLKKWKERDPFFSPLFEGMRERAQELGFRLEEFPVFGEGAPDGRQLTRILLARGIRGVILMPGGGLLRGFPDFDSSRFTIVAAAFHAQQMLVHRTASDYVAGMELCLAQAQARGYRRIGLAVDQVLDPQVRYAFSGRFLVWQYLQATRWRVPFAGGRDGIISRESFLSWYHRYRPECIISPRYSVLDWLHEAGVRVPDDVGCMFLPVRETPGICGVDMQTPAVGRASVNLLTRELFLNHIGPSDTPEVVLVGCRWQEGGTLRESAAERTRTKKDNQNLYD